MSGTLILGGARSGKSSLAQQMAHELGGKVLFVATAEAGDAEMAARIAAHKQARPADWTTLEATTGLGPKITAALRDERTVVIDCITLLVNNLFQHHGWPDDAALMERVVREEIEGIIACMDNAKADFVIVSNEVGLGIVPADPLSRIYRDVLGRANQLMAARADAVYLLVAGLSVTLKSPGR
jgi:adenosylcobinamide kinase/adenosylcobinamide-phosphate guanylyltransferase